MVKKLTISDNESSSEENVVEEVKKEEVPTKPKKVLSEKQKEALIKGRLKRLEKIDEKKLNQKIEASKFLLEQDHKNKKVKKAKVESDEEVDEEVVIIEKKRKPRKTVKRIIVEESESDTDHESPDISPEPPKIQEKKMKSQRNKKSVITVHSEPKDEENNKPSKKVDFKQYFI